MSSPARARKAVLNKQTNKQTNGLQAARCTTRKLYLGLRLGILRLAPFYGKICGRSWVALPLSPALFDWDLFQADKKIKAPSIFEPGVFWMQDRWFCYSTFRRYFGLGPSPSLSVLGAQSVEKILRAGCLCFLFSFGWFEKDTNWKPKGNQPLNHVLEGLGFSFFMTGGKSCRFPSELGNVDSGRWLSLVSSIRQVYYSRVSVKSSPPGCFSAFPMIVYFSGQCFPIRIVPTFIGIWFPGGPQQIRFLSFFGF